MPKGRGNANPKLEKAREPAMANDNVVVMRSLVITEQRDETMAKEFSAKMPSLSRLKCGVVREQRAKELSPKMSSSERSLDICLRLEDKTFMCFSIPGITTTLNSLSSSSSSKRHHPHLHNFDETPRPLDTNYDIRTNRFPVILPDFKGPFPLPGITGPFFRSAVVGHTLFFVGGDRDDIQGFDDIQTERTSYPFAPPSPPKRYYSSPPPRNRISDQLHNLTNEYLRPPFNFQTLTSWENNPCAVNDPHTVFQPPWEECDFETTDNCFLDPYTQTTTLTSPVDDHTMDPTTVTGHVDKPLTSGFLSWDDLCPVTTASTSSTETPSPTTAPESPKEPIKGICHKIWTFNLRNPDLGWSEGESLISPRIFPILAPYQGKLYAFSGNHPSLTFAEVYDPISASWTVLPPAPFRRLPDSQMYVIPLKGWNKLWVFGVHRPVDYTFDVLTQKWQKFTGSRDILPHFTDLYGLVSALTPEKHMVVYWINEEEVVYAYNLSTNQLFKGVICGSDCKEESLGTLVGLHHLDHDLFCLISCTYLLDPVRTIVHVTLLQVSIKPLPKSSKPPVLLKAPLKIDMARSKVSKAPPNPLTAAVVGCFAYPLKGEIGIYESYIRSKNVQINKITSGKGNA